MRQRKANRWIARHEKISGDENSEGAEESSAKKKKKKKRGGKKK